jgi:DNA polymerase-3 subunit alpha (Gram-positive type)
MAFYDYIEIQPIENYSYLLNVGDVASKEQLIRILNDIIEAADELGKPICATGDCHYVNPEDKITRDVYISAKAIGGGRHPLNPPSAISSSL